MAATLNKTIIIGRLGNDPEVRQSSRTDVARFSLCNTVVRDGREDAQWHRICAFGRQAQMCGKYLHKGDLCCVEGRLDVNQVEKDGEKRTYHTIIAERVTFLSSSRKDVGRLEKGRDARAESAP